MAARLTSGSCCGIIISVPRYSYSIKFEGALQVGTCMVVGANVDLPSLAIKIAQPCITLNSS
jgi:hypothetical protein